MLPVNHRMDLEDSQSPGTTEKTTSMRINSKVIQKPQKSKILIIGDSHARGCTAELSSTFGETFKVKGTVMPCSRLEHITTLARREISHLHRNDFVVIWGVCVCVCACVCVRVCGRARVCVCVCVQMTSARMNPTLTPLTTEEICTPY